MLFLMMPALVVLAAPEEALLPGDRSLETYMNNGGKLLVLLDPDGDPLEPLLGKMGLKAGSAALLHTTKRSFARHVGKATECCWLPTGLEATQALSTCRRTAPNSP